MVEFFGWLFTAIAAKHVFNTYRHVNHELAPSYWGGASAASEACMACGSLVLAMSMAVNRNTSILLWAIMAVGLTAFILGLKLDTNAKREAAQQALAADAASRRR